MTMRGGLSWGKLNPIEKIAAAENRQNV